MDCDDNRPNSSYVFTVSSIFASFINGYRLRDAETKLRETDDKLEFRSGK